MQLKRVTRRLRLSMAPPGSRRDRYLKELLRLKDRARQVSLAGLAIRLLPAFLSRPLREARRKRRLALARPFQEQLKEICNAHAGATEVIIFPPSLDWQTQLFQRPQQLALALARQGALIFYTQEWRARQPLTLQTVSERIYLCRLPLEAFEIFHQPLIYLLTWNRADEKAFQEPRVIYDYVDEIEVFAGNLPRMRRDHLRLLTTARLVLATAERLYQQTVSQRADTLLCPNGVDYEHFAASREQSSGPPPPDLAPILAENKPIIGYYGALAVWFDYDLLGALARQRPDLNFVLIGPDYDGTLPPGFLDGRNLHWLGQKAYPDLPRYLRHFDVATIPFKLNDITHSTSPLKLFEYLAGGKPVVITPMHESLRYAGVLAARTPEEFSTRIDEALRLRTDPAYGRLIDEIARQNTWDARARQILAALAEHAGGATSD